MSVPAQDTRLSLMARGLLAYLEARGATTFSLDDILHAEAGGVGKDRAIRLAGELKSAGLVHRTRGGYTLVSSPGEPFNNSVSSGKSEFPENTELRLHTCIDLEIQSVVDAQGELTEVPENPPFSSSPLQPALTGLPDTPTPVPAPPAPKKPRKPRRSEVPAEIRALYPALFELTKSPQKGKRAMGVYTKARDLWNEFGATPEQVAAFWSWFRMFSTAAQQAARERRTLNPPMPRQVYEDWPQFLAWWEAKQADDARERARREAEAAQVREPVARGASARGIHPFRMSPPTSSPATPPPVAMVAAGRAT